MSLTIDAEKALLHLDADGVVRVAGTRVTLDTIVAAFEAGATAEEITQHDPTVALADVYAVIGYCLRQREQVSEYMRERQRQANALRAENEARPSPRDIRARLLTRRSGWFARGNEMLRLAADENFNNDILLLSEYSLPGEWEGQVRYLPLQ